MKAVLVPVALLAAALAGCGGESSARDPIKAVSAGVRDQVKEAQTVDPASFPQPDGRPLEAFASQFDTSGPQAIAASSVFHPGKQRLAFGLLDAGQKFVYGKTVVYLQRRAGGPVKGPYAAPADVLVTAPRYRSQQAASEKSPFAAIYNADVDLPKPGIYNVLVLSDVNGKRIAGTMALQAVSKEADKIPDVGEKAPPVQTDTMSSVNGDIKMLDTRVPAARELAKQSFADVVGKKPVALLFATPQLCQSRVCGPVVDEMLQLKARYGDKMTFIHQEVYADNDPNKGLRKPLQEYHLPSEPWLFTVRSDGTIAARLEGSIGLNAFQKAIDAALR